MAALIHRMVSVATVALVLAASSFAQSGESNRDVETRRALAEIRKEGFEHSQVMEIVHYLTDQFGPRLTGSPSLEKAGEWALNYLTKVGLENARIEGWNWGHSGWGNKHLDLHMISPVQEPLVGEVLAWTPGTNGTIRGDVIRIIPPGNPTMRQLEDYLNGVRKHVTGRIVFVGEGGPDVKPDDYSVAIQGSGSGVLTPREIDQYVADFLLENDALVRVNPSGMPDGLIRAFGNRTFDTALAIPTVILRTEDYGRISRLIDHAVPVRLEIYIENEEFPEGVTAYNYLAEILGRESPDEVVMLGGHLDSWHAATGATDNAAGSAVMIEAVRILKSLNLTPRKTIRIALWSGEEQGVLGSQEYVARHFGTHENPRDQYWKFGGYVNVDTGTGRLRGATVFGPEEAARVLTAMFEPLHDLGMEKAEATDSRIIGGSDHTSFNHAGLPGISMTQDPVRYRTHTWHTNLDTYEQLLPEDLKQAAVVVASTIYQMAMAREQLPRFDKAMMPKMMPNPAPAR